MRTFIVLLIGIAVLFTFVAVATALNKERDGRPLDGAMIFVWVWLGFVIVDCYAGVSAGHGLGLELAIHALVFAVPAAVAWYLSRRSRSGPAPASASRQE